MLVYMWTTCISIHKPYLYNTDHTRILRAGLSIHYLQVSDYTSIRE